VAAQSVAKRDDLFCRIKLGCKLRKGQRAVETARLSRADDLEDRLCGDATCALLGVAGDHGFDRFVAGHARVPRGQVKAVDAGCQLAHRRDDGRVVARGPQRALRLEQRAVQVLAGMLSVFVIDSLGSVMSGAVPNVFFNVVVLLTAAGPLWRPAREA
jgi:hypothetical protein